MQKNGGSEGEVNRRSGAQKPPYMATLASHVLSVVADRDIVSCKHTPRQEAGKRAISARFLMSAALNKHLSGNNKKCEILRKVRKLLYL